MEYISLYGLAKEMAIEDDDYCVTEGKITDKDAFDTYENKIKRRLDDILKDRGLYNLFWTGKNYKIPVEDKESLKNQIRSEIKLVGKKTKKIAKLDLKISNRIDMEFVREQIEKEVRNRLLQHAGNFEKKVSSDIMQCIEVEMDVRIDTDLIQDQLNNAIKKIVAKNIETSKISLHQDIMNFITTELRVNRGQEVSLEAALNKLNNSRRRCEEIKGFTDKILKNIEYQLTHPITYKEINDFSQFHVYQGKKIINEEQEQEIRNIKCFCHAISMRKATEEVGEAIMKLVQSDIGNTMDSEIHHQRRTTSFSEKDIAGMIYQYYFMMKEQSEKWKLMFDIVKDLRLEEASDAANLVDIKPLSPLEVAKRAYEILLEDNIDEKNMHNNLARLRKQIPEEKAKIDNFIVSKLRENNMKSD